MSRQDIEFRDGTATREVIQGHLEACDQEFFPRLSLKVDVEDYSSKISANAQTFEAWCGDTLVGLVAAYMNDRDKRMGFITNVTVVKEFMGRGIAAELLERCVARSGQAGINAIWLEVSVKSPAAIRLYEKLGFSEVSRKEEILSMKLVISGNQQS